MRSSWLVSLVSASLGLALAACGSRSSLGERLPAGEGGTGGTGTGGGTGATSSGGTGPGSTTATTTTTSSSTGGTGGSVTVACDKLVVDGPPLTPGFSAGNKQFGPWLVRTQSGGSKVGFVYTEAQNPFEQVLPAASVELGDPWGVWPASLGDSVVHDATSGFVAGDDQGGQFSMLDYSKNPLGMHVSAVLAGMPGSSGSYYGDVTGGPPVLVTSNGPEYLAGFHRVFGTGLSHLVLVRMTIPDPDPSVGIDACSLDTAPSGAAIPFGGGYLVAMSSGRPFGSCLDDQFPDGPPTRIQIAAMPDKPQNAMLMFENEDADHYVFQTHLTPAAGGAWAGWERISFEPPFQRRIQLLQIDGMGFPQNGKIFELGYGTVAAPFAIAGLGTNVAVATMIDEPGSPRRIEVDVMSEDGFLLGEASFTAEGNFDVDYSVALLGSPAGDHLLVAWSESSIGNSDEQHVRVARLACAGAL